MQTSPFGQAKLRRDLRHTDFTNFTDRESQTVRPPKSRRGLEFFVISLGIQSKMSVCLLNKVEIAVAA